MTSYLITICLLIPAQTTGGRLTVAVRDTTGAAVPGAAVTIDGRPPVTHTTGRDGIASFSALRPDAYAITITASGFGKVDLRGPRALRVSGSETAVTIVLSPGGINEAVEVAGTPGGGAAAIVRAIDGDAMRAQPSADRDVLSFVQQSGGVAPPAPGSRLSTQGNTAVNSSGAREASNNFLIDGLDNNDLFINRLIVTPSLDAIAGVTVRQNTYDAEFGRNAGAQIDMTLKSGTSEFRGTGYEFFRPSTKNLFGGTFGGPAGRSGRSFFFGSAEGVDASEADRRLAHVPTPLERSGDFSQSGVTIVDPFTGRPFPGNVIPPQRISAASAALAALYPLPNRPDPATNFESAPNATRAGANAALKVDTRIRRDDLLSVRYSFSTDTRDFPFVARNRDLPGFGLHSLDRGNSLGGALTETWTPRLMNVARAGVTFSRRDNVPGHGSAQPTYLVTGFETLGDDPNLPVTRRTRTIQASDVVTAERGRHQVKIGGEFRSFGSDGSNELFSRGRVSFSGAFTGNGFADLLLGYPSFGLLAVNDNRQALRTWSLDAFTEDDWRVSSRVTVSAGVRYEFNAPPYDVDNRMRIFDLDRRQLVDVGANGVSRSGLHSDFNNVAPRIGVSWDPAGSATTIVRAGYGIFYDSGTLIENSALYFNPPYYSLTLYFPTATSLIRIEDPFPSTSGVSPLTSVNTIDPNFRTAYAHQASASIERNWRGVTATARYVGAFGRNLVRKRNLNQPAPGPGALDPRRPISGFGDILLVESKAHSTYHSLQISVDRPWRNGFEAHAAYTLSRSMDDASAFLASEGNDNTPQDSRNLAAEWGPSDFDVRHRLVASLTWQTSSGPAAWWRRNWQASALFTAQSGRPYTPRLSFDNSNTGNAGGATFASDRPDLVDGQFVIPAKYTFGNAGRNIRTGPGYASLDALVSRRFAAGGRRVLEVRVEAFNLLNRRNGQLPDSFVDHATFGQVLAWYPMRQWQIAGRISW